MCAFTFLLYLEIVLSEVPKTLLVIFFKYTQHLLQEIHFGQDFMPNIRLVYAEQPLWLLTAT